MANIRIEIDTDSKYPVTKVISSTLAPTPKPMILVSTVHLDVDLRNAFERGANQRPTYRTGVDYEAIEGIIQQYDGPDRLIITGGGLIAFNGARDRLQRSNFVSLVGIEPTDNLRNCYGGVTLGSIGANGSRVDYLVSKGRARANIGLFCNRKSAMNSTEVTEWGSIGGVNTHIVYGGNVGGHNNSSRYLEDLRAADAGITTLVISADPFFQDTKDKLVKAANDWVAEAAPGTRYICYPFSDYGNVHGAAQPTPGTASWYGPALSDAYEALGAVAALALNATSPLPFSDVGSTSGGF
jgi:hypothetical protein